MWGGWRHRTGGSTSGIAGIRAFLARDLRAHETLVLWTAQCLLPDQALWALFRVPPLAIHSRYNPPVRVAPFKKLCRIAWTAALLRRPDPTLRG